MKSNAEIKRETRAKRKAKGFVKAEVYIKPKDAEKLSEYVNEILKGEYNPRKK